MYTNNSIDKVREADIVKTIESYVKLKKSGSTYKGLSPFVTEKTPSFMVSPSKQIFKDFSSGIGGDGIKFVMEYEKCDFVSAIEKIASIHNIFLEDEPISKEAQRFKKQRADLIHLVSQVGNIYRNNFQQLPKTHWAKKMLADRGYSSDTIIDFQIGFARGDNQITTELSAQAKIGPAIDVGLLQKGQHNTYDFFRNRLLFPIYTTKGALVAFGGRRQNGKEFEKQPKYINSKESKLYNKSKVLYGLHLTRRSIAKSGWAILTEGYTDVIGMYDKGADNTVATCGTALTDTHIKELHKYCEHIVLFRDGDRAGIEATKRDIDICLAEGFKVSICQLKDGMDPDDFARETPNPKEWVFQNAQDALLWHTDIIIKEFERDNYKYEVANIQDNLQNTVATLEQQIQSLDDLKADEKKDAAKSNKNIQSKITRLTKEAEKEIKSIERIDPYYKDKGITKVVNSLVLIKNEIQLKEYVRQLSKVLEVPVKTLQTRVDDVRAVAFEKAKQSKDKKQKPPGFPKGADLEQYFRDNYCEVGNAYHFRKNDIFFKGTNFKITALYHIKGRKENKRLCEVENEQNFKTIIDFDSEAFVNWALFRKSLIQAGNYHFGGNTNTNHFALIANKALNEFETAYEIQTMGWNAKGFFAFANGSYWKNVFQATNQYGIMRLEGVDEKKEDDGYSEKVEFYYSPAFSVMHKHNQKGDDPYENDRKFVYKQSAISLDEWMSMMVKVFRKKGMIGVVFNFAALFRDIFMKNYKFFPLLGGFGEKGSGKSVFGEVLQNFFFYNDKPLELNTTTVAAITRRLARITNTVTFLDEYNNNLDDKIMQALKGVWGGLGREKGLATTDQRTVTDVINQAVYYAGQYIPTQDDNALQTRTIIELFSEPKNKYSAEAKADLNRLVEKTNKGISSLVFDIIEHRQFFIDNLISTYNEVVKEIKTALKEEDYTERIADNLSVLMITYKILANKINFPFTYETFKAYCLELIISNSNSIADSNGLTEFWQTLQFLFEKNVIRDEEHFKITKPVSFTYEPKKNVKDTWNNPERSKRVLFLRLNMVHQFYAEAISHRKNAEIVGENDIRQYFKSRGYYIGRSNQKFKNNTYSCYAFDYEQMQSKFIVTLHENKEPVQSGEDDTDDLPF